MAPSNLSTPVHSINERLSQNQAAPEVTAFPVPSHVNQQNPVSVQDILFGILTIILATVSVLLAYLQLVQMRKQARSPRLDVEMLSIHGPSRQDSNQSSSSTSGDTAVEVETPQENLPPVPPSSGKSNTAVLESEVGLGVPSRRATSLVAAIERTNDDTSPARDANANVAMNDAVEAEVAHGTTTRQATMPAVLEGPATGEVAASETSKSSL